MATKIKSKIVITIIAVTLLLSLCACNAPTNQTRTVSIGLPVSNGPALEFGTEFTVVEATFYNSYCCYEILPNQIDEFVALLEKQEYYRGKIILNEPSTLFPYEIKPFKFQDECMWFSHDGSVWVGKKYTNKFFYFAQVYNSFLNGDNFFGNISSLLFDDIAPVKDITTETEYSTSLSWADIKKVYAGLAIDEDDRSIKFNCYILTYEDPDHLTKPGLATLVYNEENKTIKVLNEYVEK